MKTLSAPLIAQKDAVEAGWIELYDIYLPSAISTPWGTVSTLRLAADYSGAFQFFTPQTHPEPSGTRGDAATYQPWPIKRTQLKLENRFANDKLSITASNVTQEWVAMLEAVDWSGVPVMIRKVSTSIAAPAAADHSVYFSGVIEHVTEITKKQISFQVSNEMDFRGSNLPAENYHGVCRARWGDDLCGALRFRAENYKSKTCGAACTTTLVKSADFSEDTGANGALGTELVNPLANGNITTSSEVAGNEGYKVKSSFGAFWQLASTADWGTNVQGIWQIPDAQAGLANFDLKPWIQFDFGSAKTPRLWSIFHGNFPLENLMRLILFFSSTNNSTWKFESYYELPMRSITTFYPLIHGAQTARYWRICVRNTWGPIKTAQMFSTIKAYEGGRHWWAHGWLTFASNTTTVALRGVTVRVLESYAGEVVTTKLPVAPANGDTFIIERDCPKTFNGCAERLNHFAFAGFDSIPFQTIPR